MCRFVVLFASVCLASCLFAQSSSPLPATPSSTLQIVYTIDGSTLNTYNVNSQTLQATQVGTTTLQQAVYPNLVTSPNGHTLYYMAYQNTNEQGQQLYVYDTDGLGVPGSQPIQTLNAQGFYTLQVDPTNKFLYLVHRGPVGSEYTFYTIRRYRIEANTGKISQPVTEATYKLPTASSALYCWLGVFGMNASGTKLYDQVSCGYPFGGSEATYNERSVDPQTGSLGPDQKIYGWNNSSLGGEDVQFVKNLMFDFVVPNNWQQNANYIDIYRLEPNASKPLIHCTESMLADCGSDSYGAAHPSAQYIFMVASTSMTNIDKVELSSKQIVGTLSTIPSVFRQFSPDGSIAYATSDVNGALLIEIYGFDVATAGVTQGGTISVPSDLDSWWAVERR